MRAKFGTENTTMTDNTMTETETETSELGRHGLALAFETHARCYCDGVMPRPEVVARRLRARGYDRDTVVGVLKHLSHHWSAWDLAVATARVSRLARASVRID